LHNCVRDRRASDTARTALPSSGRESGRDTIAFAEKLLARGRLPGLIRPPEKSLESNITGKSVAIARSKVRKH